MEHEELFLFISYYEDNKTIKFEDTDVSMSCRTIESVSRERAFNRERPYVRIPVSFDPKDEDTVVVIAVRYMYSNMPNRGVERIVAIAKSPEHAAKIRKNIEARKHKEYRESNKEEFAQVVLYSAVVVQEG